MARKKLTADTYWYKDAIIYEVHVRSFKDGNSDGIGDFVGLTEKLPYLHELGVTAIWLLPFFPSPLRDDGYDIADYYSIHPDYGTLSQFKKFIAEAHKRDIRIIAELAINHTSSDHPWFQRARRAKEGSSARNYYVWSRSPQKYGETRIIFKDFETSNWSYDAVADRYYWHRFYSHQPDLNFDNPAVQKQVLKVLDHWFSLGVDGLRLDAIPYLFERENTNCENLPETHMFLKKVRRHVDQKYPDRMFLAEANQWPEDAVEYFGTGDECHMSFHFPLMPRLFMAARMEDTFPIIDILKSTPAIPESCQWAMFLRNHDELTLEMVTDEERDYMYRVYAQDPQMKINVGIRRRLAPLLGNNQKKIEMMNILLFSFPGTPVLYYGDEIGMGDNHFLGDRNGVRTPMQWSTGKNAGFSDANPQKLYLPVIIDPQYHFQAVNVENQMENRSSPFWWMKRVIAMRKKYGVFGRGDLRFVNSDNSKVLSFIRIWEDEQVLVVVNLSRFMQVVSLEMESYAGKVPEELFSRNTLPAVGRKPYVLTLGPYNHFWLMLHKQKSQKRKTAGNLEVFTVQSDDWRDVLKSGTFESTAQEVLFSYLHGRRWFGAKSRVINSITIYDTIEFNAEKPYVLLLLSIRYKEGNDERYLLPIAFEPVASAAANDVAGKNAFCVVKTFLEQGFLYDASYNEGFQQGLLSLIQHRKRAKGASGTCRGIPGKQLKTIVADEEASLQPHILNVEQSNTSILYGEKLFLKLYRKLDDGVNPDIEMLSSLTEKSRFRNMPLYAGTLEYRGSNGNIITLTLLQGYVKCKSDSWNYVLQTAGRFYDSILSEKSISSPEESIAPPSIFDVRLATVPGEFMEHNGSFFYEMIELLGKRTAEMHCALAGAKENGFSPEPFTQQYQRSLYQSIQGQVGRCMQILNKRKRSFSGNLKDDVEYILASERSILSLIKKNLQKKYDAQKIRIHGDYHLGQVLFTGKDFIIIDFEGEPARTLGERKLRYSCFRDVAGMVRSFHYAAYGSVYLNQAYSENDKRKLSQWIEFWYTYTAGIFLEAYLKHIESVSVLPKNNSDRESLLNVYLLEKAMYELGYEVDNRPGWAGIPINGITSVIETLAKEGK